MDCTKQTNDMRLWRDKKDQKDSEHSINAEIRKNCAGNGMVTMESKK